MTTMRDPLLDNAKVLLIVFVVFGHMLEPIVGKSHLAHALYLWIYAFHMPGFVFLAGITMRPEKWGSRDRTLAWTLVIFQFAYMAVALICGAPVGFPYWLLWFLLSLLYWRAAAAFIVARAPQRLVLASCVALSAATGYLPFGNSLSIKRTLVFAPFFFGGMLYGRSTMDWIRRRSTVTRVVSACALLVAFIAATRWSIDLSWLYGTVSFRHTETPLAEAWAIRLVLLAVTMVLVLAFLVLIPRHTTRFTHRGRNTLSVYLLHGLLVIPLRGPVAHLPLGFAWGAILIATSGMLMVFSSDTVNRILNRLIRVPVPKRNPLLALPNSHSDPGRQQGRT
jgi:fucose 4-O-acetylase-like acetyltransferase